jgi:N-acetylneuraminate synthase
MKLRQESAEPKQVITSNRFRNSAGESDAPRIKIGNRWIGDTEPTYFIADIAANHDGKLERAKDLIRLAKNAGANAAKFQNFRAPKIVSKYGFENLGSQFSHQTKWRKPVFEVYSEASLPWEWTQQLKSYCDNVGLDFLSTPYDLEAVDMLDPYVPAFKIGSGDITWPEIIEKIAGKNKPVLLSTGASDIGDVVRAVRTILPINPNLVLLQCNTNYEADVENFSHIHLRVLLTYGSMFPEAVLGLSDHTSGHTTVLGAVALGAKVVEKHFTDDNSREGPDHAFSMTPETWRAMVECTRELEKALGSTAKFVAENEQETVIIQRRCLRAARDFETGRVLTGRDIDVLRPAPLDSIFPYELPKVVGRRLRKPMRAGEHFRWTYLE